MTRKLAFLVMILLSATPAVAQVRPARAGMIDGVVTTQGGTKQNLQWAYELPRVRVNGPDPLTAWASKFP